MAHARNETVLDWIVMDIVHVPVQIHFVADRVLPETALPQRILAASIALDRQPTRDDVAAEQTLDPPPAAGEICIFLRKRHDDVQMIRKDHDGIDGEWALPASDTKSASERDDVVDQNGRTSVGGGDGKEKCSAGDEAAPIVDHQGSIARSLP